MQQSILSQAVPLETQVVDHDAFDRATFQSMKESAEALAEAQEAGTKELTTFPPLMQDMFNSLYKYNPKIKDPGEIRSSHRFNHTLVNKAIETDQYNHLRQYTKLDEVNSALATVSIANKMIETIQTELREQAEQANKLVKQEDITQQFLDAAASLSDIAQKARGSPQATEKLKKAKAAAAQAAKAQ
jgi:GTP1/Obg family GTP-binding protein